MYFGLYILSFLWVIMYALICNEQRTWITLVDKTNKNQNYKLTKLIYLQKSESLLINLCQAFFFIRKQAITTVIDSL